MMHPHYQFANESHPQLVPSVTEDDDDEDDDEEKENVGMPYPTPRHNIINQRRSSIIENNNHAIAYFLRYETSIRQQEAGDMATMAHLRSCIERILELSGVNEAAKKSDADLLMQQISFGDLDKARQKLEASNRDDINPEFMTTDQQVMMVLRTVTEDLEEHDKAVEITFAEFVQAYKLCITGIEALQNLPATTKPDARNRARNRILSMLRLFDAGSTSLFDGTLSTACPTAVGVGTTSAAPHNSCEAGVQSGVLNKSTKKGWKRIAATFLLLIALAVGASKQAKLIDPIAVFNLTMALKSLATEFHQRPNSFHRQVIKELQTSTARFIAISEILSAFAPSEVLLDHPPINEQALHVDSHTQTPICNSLAVYASDMDETVVMPSYNNVAVSAILGGIVGAAGAPYAALLLQRVLFFLVAYSASHFLLASLVAALIPMAVNGVFAHMPNYALSSELEYFPME
ncbi:hypothetical protein MPSEU_000207200 [Mayamaea pseudoterrestris]|nr:hypothetical protein MPSEU_000207200 [Mayamaea pseudoterrestris]